MNDGRKRQHHQGPGGHTPEWAENPEDVGAVRELMLLLTAYDHFQSKFSDVTKPQYAAACMKMQGNRTVSIVRFGYFRLEQITMPAAFEDLSKGYLYTEYHPVLEGSAGDGIPYQFDVGQVMS